MPSDPKYNEDGFLIDPDVLLVVVKLGALQAGDLVLWGDLPQAHRIINPYIFTQVAANYPHILRGWKREPQDP